MGNHAVSGRDATNPKGPCLPVARAVTATGVLAISVWALNLSGSALEPQATTASVVRPGAGMGAVGIPTGSSTGSSNTGAAVNVDASTESSVPPLDGLVAGPLTASVLTAPQVEITFQRPLVGSFGEDTPAPLTVALTGLGRPPAGYLMAPLRLLNPSSPFGFRVSPLSGADGDFHLGQDYAAPCGTQVYAADSGVVRAAGWHPWGGGNRVEIDHGNGLISTYNHLESIAVRSGDSVSVGQGIARVGSTGWSTGCHLHFETILNGHHVSPLKWRLMPVRPLGSGPADLWTYLPGTDAPSSGPILWTIPVGQGDEPPSAPRWANWPTTTAPASPSYSAFSPSPISPADSGTSSPSPTGSGTSSPSPTGSGTSSPSPTDSDTPSPAPVEPVEPAPIQPPPAPVEPPPAPVEPVPVPVEPTPIQPPPAPVEPVPVPVEPAPIQPPPAPVEPAPIQPPPAPVEPVPAPVEPSPIVPTTAPIAPIPEEPAPAPIEPAPTEPALPTSPSTTPEP